jgi:hypothetical protein
MRRLGLLVIVLAVLAGCGGEDTSPQDGDAAADPTSASVADGVELEGETLDGTRLSLADFRGTPVFVNVWASW